MKRRQALQSIFTLPAIAALPAAAQDATPKPVAEDTAKLATVAAEFVAAPAPRFFSNTQFQTLRHLASLLMPKSEEAGAAEFLDFLISQSPPARQALYRGGLDALNAARPFAGLDAAAAAELLKPLSEPWTHAPPDAILPRFLRAVKEDVFRATVNSRQWAAAATGRRGAGTGSYWLAME
ncbi:MAG: gluconate 2-dehydrogenase subunit 3 family protein [Acidobacteriota bacterium]|nr:gluconate 2-dehydrogenase subunit 3 family protein [Acidobacteriota bacterium]